MTEVGVTLAAKGINKLTVAERVATAVMSDAVRISASKLVILMCISSMLQSLSLWDKFLYTLTDRFVCKFLNHGPPCCMQNSFNV
jgi:hypothetical protein